MARVSLKSLLGKKSEAAALITNLISALGDPIGIEDTEGVVLLGKASSGEAKHPVMLGEEIVGWVRGNESAAPLAGLLTHLANKEAEKKVLGNEVLNLYRETNLIYNFSEKLAASLEVSAIARAALEQASQLIASTGGTVLLLDEEEKVLKTAASIGRALQADKTLNLGKGIIGSIAASGNAEIVNEVRSDPRHNQDEGGISSLICAPLKVKEQTKGIVTLMSEQPATFTAGELKLLISVASQAALAIENALLHERMIKEATRHLEERRQELEIAVRERTAELAKQKENIELLSEIGKEITASLDMDTIFYKLYEHVNQLVDAAVFGVGIYHPEKAQIEYRLAIEKGKRYAPYTREMSDKNQFAVWCIENRRTVFINDVKRESGRYFSDYKETAFRLENGTFSEKPESLIYLPLMSQEKILGIITIQSFQKNTYSDYHLNLLQSLAAYTSIALDNADAYRRLDETLQNLKSTQQQLVTQEKLASLGQLTAGIAHEIKNPLNFVNNFAALSVDLAVELREELFGNGLPFDKDKRASIESLLTDIQQSAEKINQHGRRADSIVKSMMQHARGSSHEPEPSDLNLLLEDAVNLVYHGLRASDVSFSITIERDYDTSIGKVAVVPQDLQRVFLNILSNACYAANQKAKGRVGEGERGRMGDGESGRWMETEVPSHPITHSPTQPFTPTLSVSTKDLGDRIEIRIRDNGNGIPAEIREKIFNPFFTTKPTGQGTGLGLSISYDIIVQQHKGEIKVETEEGKFTEFVISLPCRG
jgi:signal transduction histidine kinase